MQPRSCIGNTPTLLNWEFFKDLEVLSQCLNSLGKPIPLTLMPLPCNLQTFLSAGLSFEMKGGKVGYDEILVELRKR